MRKFKKKQKSISLYIMTTYLCGCIQRILSHSEGRVIFHDHISEEKFTVEGTWPGSLFDLKQKNGGLFISITPHPKRPRHKEKYTLKQVFKESLFLSDTLSEVMVDGIHSTLLSKIINNIIQGMSFHLEDKHPYVEANIIERILDYDEEELFEMVVIPKIIRRFKAKDIVNRMKIKLKEKLDQFNYLEFCQKYPKIRKHSQHYLWKEYGSLINECIQNSPYRIARILAEFQGTKRDFKTLDMIVQDMFYLQANSHERIRRFAVECTRELIEESKHSYVFAKDVLWKAQQRLEGVPNVKDVIEKIWKKGDGPTPLPCASLYTNNPYSWEDWAMKLRNVGNERHIYPMPYWEAEQTITLKMMLTAHSDNDAPEKWKAALQQVTTLDEVQKNAIASAMECPITTVTGPPGTGKTRTTSVIVDMLVESDYGVIIGCPTGKAAQRLSSVLDQNTLKKLPCAPATIHAILYRLFNKFGHRVNYEGYENIALVIDEASMVGLTLMARLLRKIPQCTRIIVVGDAFQLPSISSGRVFFDLIRAAPSLVNKCELKHVYRTRGKIICENAQTVRRIIDEDEKGSFLNWFKSRVDQLQQKPGEFVITDRDLDGNERAQVSIDFYRDHNMAFKQCQIICQNVRTCNTINKSAREQLNPPSNAKKQYESKFHERIWREGDRVMCVRNIYKNEDNTVIIDSDNDTDTDDDNVEQESERTLIACNGQVGMLNKIYFVFDNGGEGKNKKVLLRTVFRVLFDDTEKTEVFDSNTFDECFQWAYAITTHKSQGSEWDAILMHLDAPNRSPLHSAHLFYTGFTRAQSSVIIEGTRTRIEQILQNTEAVSKRNSRLSVRLQNSEQSQKALRTYLNNEERRELRIYR